MLDERDLKAIAELIDARAAQTEEKLTRHTEELLDSRMGEMENRFNTRMEKLENRFDVRESRFDVLESRFDVLENRFDVLESRFDALENRFDVLESQFNTHKEEMEKLIDTRIRESEELLLDEMERYDKKYQRQFAEVKQRLGTLEGIYRMTKNESDTIDLSLKLIDNLDKRVSALEMRAV